MHYLNSLCTETSNVDEFYSSSSEDEECTSPLRDSENGIKFNVKEKIKELMEKPSPLSVSRKNSRFIKTKVNGDFNKGVSHKIKRPKIKKAKELKQNNAKKAIVRVKSVRSPPRLATNRSPLNPSRKGKLHKLSSPGISFLDSPFQDNESNSMKTSKKIFTSRSKDAATVKINDTIKLSAMNGEIKMRHRPSGFEKKNIGRYIEAELEKQIAATSLQSPINICRLDRSHQLPSCAARPSPPKPTRFSDSPSSKRPRSRPSTPKRIPIWASPPKHVPRCLYSSSVTNSPRRVSPRKKLSQHAPESATNEMLNGHSSSPVPTLETGSHRCRKTPQKNHSNDDLQDLDWALDKIEVAHSEDDKILSSLLKENETPKKTLDSPRRSPRKHLNTPSTEGGIPSLKKNKESPESHKNVKYFPIFEPKSMFNNGVNKVQNNTPSKGRKLFLMKKSDMSQLVIDAGQTNFGAVYCKACGFLYDSGDFEEEENHRLFHDSVPPSLKYPGWKHECQVTNMDHLGGRIIKVGPMDNAQWWRKVRQVLECVDNDLGFSESGIQNTNDTTAFLYVLGKLIVGVLIAESIDKAYKVIQSDSVGTNGEESKLICCSDKPEKVSFGISRIWVLSTQRRRGIATKLVDAMRANIVPRHFLAENDFAFSDPTLFGMRFAENYTKRSDFLVYRRD